MTSRERKERLPLPLVLLATMALVPSCGGSPSGGGDASTPGISSHNPSLSGDGNLVAFDSTSKNLTSSASSSTATSDIFVFNRSTGVTLQVSTGPNGSASLGENTTPMMASGGGFVVFESTGNLTGAPIGAAPSLTASGTSSVTTLTGATSGTTLPMIVAGSGSMQVFRTDLASGATDLVSVALTGEPADGESMNASVSVDGQLVAFESTGTDLVSAGSIGSSQTNVFVRDMQTGVTRLLSAPASGKPDGSSRNVRISDNGQWVVFETDATNLLSTGLALGTGHTMIVLGNLMTGALTLISMTSSGLPGNADSALPSVNSDGSFVTFESRATNLVQATIGAGLVSRSRIFVWSSATGQVAALPALSGQDANGDSHHASISGDGRLVVFESEATNLTMDTDLATSPSIFVHDRQSGTSRTLTPRMTGAITGATTVGTMNSGMTSITGAAILPPSGRSQNPRISRDGSWVGFESTATDMVPTPVTMSDNVFLAKLPTGALMLVSEELPVAMTTGSTVTTTGATTGASTGASTGISTGTVTAATGATTPTLSGGTTAAAGSTVGMATSTSPASPR